QGDRLIVLRRSEHAHSLIIFGAHFVRDGRLLRNREAVGIPLEVQGRGWRWRRRQVCLRRLSCRGVFCSRRAAQGEEQGQPRYPTANRLYRSGINADSHFSPLRHSQPLRRDASSGLDYFFASYVPGYLASCHHCLVLCRCCLASRRCCLVLCHCCLTPLCSRGSASSSS